MWISSGGAASQLFGLDTDVATPLILGEHLVHDPGVNVAFGIANLDPDVVDIALGSSAVGILSIHSFFNNQDGTGSFQVTFDTSYPTRYLSIVATDDVANQSNESPVFLVHSLEEAKLNEVFSILPQSTVHTDTCNRLLDEIPRTDFILKRRYSVPYSYNPAVFELSAVTPGAPVEVVVIRKGVAGEESETQQYVVIPYQPTTSINIRLCKGINVIAAMDRYGRSDTIIVAATVAAAVMCSYAKEIYNYSQVMIEEQQNAIYSPISTRLAEPLLTFSDLLPDVKAQQTLATKLAVRSLVGSPGREIGVRDLLTALTLSTPIFVEETPDSQYFEPNVRPLFNAQEMFAGVDAHVWMSNECVRRWLAFIRYINNLSMFKVVSITENEVIFRDENGDLQRHVFDFTQDKCSLTILALQSICFEDIEVGVSIYSETDIRICAAAYPLDMRATEAHPVRPVHGEVENEFGLDPGFDGYAEFGVTEHWDGGTVLDSQGATPSVVSGLVPCVYENGYLMAPLLLASHSASIDAAVSADGEYSVQPGVESFLDILIAGGSMELSLDMMIQTSPWPRHTANLDVVISGVSELEIGMNVAITAPAGTYSVAASMNMAIVV